jgi:hypothetical protein
MHQTNPELFIQDSIRQAMLNDSKNDAARWLHFLGMHNFADSLQHLEDKIQHIGVLIMDDKTIAGEFLDGLDGIQKITEQAIIDFLDNKFEARIKFVKCKESPEWQYTIIFDDNSAVVITRDDSAYTFQDGHYIPKNQLN